PSRGRSEEGARKERQIADSTGRFPGISGYCVPDIFPFRPAAYFTEPDAWAVPGTHCNAGGRDRHGSLPAELVLSL
ncbi:MAG TPA: hypothetical protein VF243_02910, partial [Nitrosospira sp.]